MLSLCRTGSASVGFPLGVDPLRFQLASRQPASCCINSTVTEEANLLTTRLHWQSQCHPAGRPASLEFEDGASGLPDQSPRLPAGIRRPAALGDDFMDLRARHCAIARQELSRVSSPRSIRSVRDRDLGGCARLGRDDARTNRLGTNAAVARRFKKGSFLE